MTDDGVALEASGLGKRYGWTWGLRDCSFRLPRGRVAALVGPNGSGKSTLLRMAAGLTRPTTGAVRVLGRSPQTQATDVLRLVGYLDQARPLYRTFRVEEMLRLGRSLNPGWDEAAARRALDDLDIPMRARVRNLSGGQQAQVALTLCLAKRPELLLLDEPVAALDPLAREQVLHTLMGSVVDDGATVLLSSHTLPDLQAVCDYVIILARSQVQLAGDLDTVLAGHRLLIGPRREVSDAPGGMVVVSAAATDRQSTWLVRADGPVTDPSWQVAGPTLEEIVVAYLRAGPRPSAGSPAPVPSDGRAMDAERPIDDEEVAAR